MMMSPNMVPSVIRTMSLPDGQMCDCLQRRFSADISMEVDDQRAAARRNLSPAKRHANWTKLPRNEERPGAAKFLRGEPSDGTLYCSNAKLR
jgi:hypothetical protein